jgi:hypothetical protein
VECAGYTEDGTEFTAESAHPVTGTLTKDDFHHIVSKHTTLHEGAGGALVPGPSTLPDSCATTDCFPSANVKHKCTFDSDIMSCACFCPHTITAAESEQHTRVHLGTHTELGTHVGTDGVLAADVTDDSTANTELGEDRATAVMSAVNTPVFHATTMIPGVSVDNFSSGAQYKFKNAIADVLDGIAWTQVSIDDVRVNGAASDRRLGEATVTTGISVDWSIVDEDIDVLQDVVAAVQTAEFVGEVEVAMQSRGAGTPYNTLVMNLATATIAFVTHHLDCGVGSIPAGPTCVRATTDQEFADSLHGKHLAFKSSFGTFLGTNAEAKSGAAMHLTESLADEAVFKAVSTGWAKTLKLETDNGRFLSARNSGALGTQSYASSWESIKVTVIDFDTNTVALRGIDNSWGQYMLATEDGAVSFEGSADDGAAVTFTVHAVGTHTEESGDDSYEA